MKKPKHSRLGASSAARWFACPGSVALSAQCPPAPSSPYAEEGTAAHELAEKCLRDAPAASYYAMTKAVFNKHTVTVDMAGHVQAYVDYVRALVNETGGELLVEKKFHLSTLHPDLYGTCDAVVYEDFGALHVLDFKYGAGLAVNVVENEQIMYYALGALDLGDFETVTLHICQPRMEHEDGAFRSWVTTPEALREFGKELRAKALLTQKKDAPLKSGDHCRFCPAAGVCPELHKTAVDVARSDFENPKLPAVSALTPHQIARVVEHRKLIESWLESVSTHALNALMSGEKIDGLKIVKGRARREWSNEEEARKALCSNLGPGAYKQTLLSVSQAEKVLGKDWTSGLFDTLDGRPTVAHVGDRRKEITSAKDDFTLDQTDF